MQLCDIFLRLGSLRFDELMRCISVGKLKTYQLYDRVKTRLHVSKLNSESLRKSTARSWTRLEERDDEFATDISQAILVSHLEMIKAVLDHLGVPHEEGFFAKDADVAKHLAEGWQQGVWEKFAGASSSPAPSASPATFPPAPLLFYINHLAWEIAKAEDVFAPAA
jgi:hypothetical protein